MVPGQQLGGGRAPAPAPAVAAASATLAPPAEGARGAVAARGRRGALEGEPAGSPSTSSLAREAAPPTPRPAGLRQVPFSEFVRQLEADAVREVEIDGMRFRFQLRAAPPGEAPHIEGGPSPAPQPVLRSTRPADMATPYDLMVQNGVIFGSPDRASGRFLTAAMYGLYTVLLFGAVGRLLPGRGGGRGGVLGSAVARGRSASKGPLRQLPSVRFSDVAGVDEAKDELEEVVEYLRNPERFKRVGARPPAGLLLVGAPGTGKTLLAKAVAGEAGVPFFSMAASEFVELYVGMGAARVRELFVNARKESPAIVFIDEIDAVAKGRDTKMRSVGNDEREQTLNQLLVEMDGFDSGEAEDGGKGLVICIAATNRPDVLDAALLRPGRFDRRVPVELPDCEGRLEILGVHVQRQGLPLASGVSLGAVAAQTTGFTGADLANLVNEAALLAGRERALEVSSEHFDAAAERMYAGIEKKRSILRGPEKETVARHEVGHALVGTAVSRLLPGLQTEVEKLSIVPRSGGALGFAYMPPGEDRALMFDAELLGRLAIFMGGRAAEELTCDRVSTGAMDDIQRATEMAYKAVAEYGLSSAVGPLSYLKLQEAGSEGGLLLGGSQGKTGERVESEVKRLLDEALGVARAVLQHNRAVLAELSSVLADEERLEGDSLREGLSGVSAPPALVQYLEAPGDRRRAEKAGWEG